MVEKLKELAPEMDDDNLLAALLNQIYDKAEQDVAAAIDLCAIPHWFNEKILSWLRYESEISNRTRVILANLNELGLVVPYEGKIWTFHQMIRDFLLKRWCRTNLAGFHQVNLRMAEFYKDSVENRFEFIYHLLAGGDKKGFELLVGEVAQSNRYFYFSTAERLLYLAKETCIKLIRSQQNQLEYYGAELAAISGYWDKALPILKSLKRRKLPEDLHAKVFLRLGTVYNRRGQWAYAINSYRKCLDFGESVDPSDMAWAYSGMGLIYAWRGEWGQAEECHNSALRVAEQSKDQLWKSRAVNNLGEIYQQTGQLDKAEDSYQKSIHMKKNLGDSYGLLWTNNNLGSLYLELEQPSKASRVLDQSLIMARDLQSPAEEARALEFMGALQMLKGNFTDAKKHYNEALLICEKINEPHRKADVKLKMGILYKYEGRIKDAVAALKEALKIYKKLKSYKASTTLEKINEFKKLA
ncbi:MAG: tetratricopeptide repeat protein [Desulfobacterales bacterium]|jgi:tetratricopeptide (TPR) repeat protein